MKDVNKTIGVVGFVLCGGKSSRMGLDKGTLLLDGEHWATVVKRCFDNLGVLSFISVNPSQKAYYQHCFAPEDLIVDEVDVQGPLAGLLTVHRMFPQSDIFLLACDMIDMDEAMVDKLLLIRQRIINADAYVYKRDGYVEPCCAIYTTRGLCKIDRWLEEGTITDYSFKNLIARLDAVYLPVDKDCVAFNNYNTEKDIVKNKPIVAF